MRMVYSACICVCVPGQLVCASQIKDQCIMGSGFNLSTHCSHTLGHEATPPLSILRPSEAIGPHHIALFMYLPLRICCYPIARLFCMTLHIASHLCLKLAGSNNPCTCLPAASCAAPMPKVLSAVTTRHQPSLLYLVVPYASK
jgi:hypothetical protein